jgi:hypothetical protein
MKPTIGRIVNYYPTTDEKEKMRVGATTNVADVLPALIVAVWTPTLINLQVFLDGMINKIGLFWVTSVNIVDERYTKEGRWEWPVREETIKSSDKPRPDNQLDYKVYPSEERTIFSIDDPDYGGAHLYIIQNSLGFSDGVAKYDNTTQRLQFVQKNLDGTMIPGVQSEQLVYILLDRVWKLNAKFPSEQSTHMITGLKMFLDACESRIKDRIKRGVMGDLKK